MANPWFQFKQFTVWHDKCGMKVGTDGVLLGAWADVSHARTILDVGTGTGLIALMIAQRSKALITAIDVDENAVLQATTNIIASPWKDRIQVMHRDYKHLEEDHKYDLIVSNPPYFISSLKSPTVARTIARHTDQLSFKELIKKSVSLLNEDGRFSLIIPTDSEELIKDIATTQGLYASKQTYVFTKPDAPSKRTLITFGFSQTKCLTNELILEKSRHIYSEEFKELTKDYYLDKDNRK